MSSEPTVEGQSMADQSMSSGDSPPPPPPAVPPPAVPPPTAGASIGSVQDWLAHAIAAFGHLLSLLTLALPWVMVADFFGGTVSEGPPGSVAAIVGIMALGGMGTLALAHLVHPLAAIASIGTAGITGLIAVANLADASEAYDQTQGLVGPGAGMLVLFLGSGLAGVASIAALVVGLRRSARA